MDSDLKLILDKKDWKVVIEKISPRFIASKLSFEEAMHVADSIIDWDCRAEEVVNYSIDLFFAIRDMHEGEWNKDGKNDLYVAQLCQLTLRYQEAFDSIKRAYDLSKPNSSPLILFYFANTYFFPPEADTISQEEAIQLFRASLEKQTTCEAALLLRDIYGYRKDIANYDYWDAVITDAQSKNLHIPIIIPDVFSEKYEKRN